ncbi:YbaB/EbfC family nucleoid-associated protein [Actinoplanes sp. NPDC048791]|uniref:YbaB/EbfC family nucleoid-associated protein n=1 Tax=Actinoplanes sp. NPDC048791 TaxID=3154623 RepID=UPI0033E9E551
MAEPTGEARPGFFPELQGLQRDAAVLAGRFAAAEAAAAEASGRDPSEKVRVVLASLGRIASVDVDPQWQSRISPDDLSAAVLAAYREASSRRLETWAAEIGRTTVSPDSHQQGSVLSDGAPEAPADAGAGVGPADESSHESIRRLWSLLQDATDRLDDVIRAATARSETVMTGRDPGRHVSASFTGGGELTDLSIDETWAADADARELGTSLTAAITDGYAAIDRSAHETTGQWPFPDLDRISGNPTALLATLGLPAIPDTQPKG